jgi:hypothetical protein
MHNAPIVREKRMMRAYTNKLIDEMDNGLLDVRYVVAACLGYMSEDDVKAMCEANDILVEGEDE